MTFVAGNALTPSIACAGLGPVDVDRRVVIGTPQTLVRRLDQLGRVDLLIIDEAHRLGRKASGQIHTIVDHATRAQSQADAARADRNAVSARSGRLTEGDDRIFETVAFEIGYLELVEQEYLAPLIGPRDAIERLDVAGLRIVGGDYSASDLARFDRSELTERIADQIVAHGAERKAWLVFAVGIDHAEHLAEALVKRGIDARLLTGMTPSKRAQGPRRRFQGGAGPLSRRLRRVFDRLRRAGRRPDRDRAADVLAGVARAERRPRHEDQRPARPTA